MAITIECEDDVQVMRIRSDTWDLVEAAHAAIAEGRPRLVLDLAGHDFLNSLKIAAVIQLRNEVVGAQGKLAVANLSQGLKKIFGVLKLEKVFALDLDLPAAKNAVSAA